MSTAKFIFDTIHTNVPIKEPNFGQWANTVRLMRKQDKRSDYDIREAICAFAQDEFWSTTCLSAENLRRNFDRAKAIKVRDRDTGESLDQYRRKT